MENIAIAGQICELASSIPHSIAAAIVTWVQLLWPKYIVIIFTVLTGWVFFEIKTRNGTWHYNSKNGFSPQFNSFIGAGTFAIFQGLMYGLFNLFTWGGAYCIPWLTALYLIPFGLTAWFLVDIAGFWVEKRHAYKNYRNKMIKRR